jgi:hypothetical protein
MGRLFIGCSGWNYGSLPDEDGGWIGVFYPDKETKRLRYYSEFFNTAEMDVKKDVIKDFEGFLEKDLAVKEEQQARSNINTTTTKLYG